MSRWQLSPALRAKRLAGCRCYERQLGLLCTHTASPRVVLSGCVPYATRVLLPSLVICDGRLFKADRVKSMMRTWLLVFYLLFLPTSHQPPSAQSVCDMTGGMGMGMGMGRQTLDQAKIVIWEYETSTICMLIWVIWNSPGEQTRTRTRTRSSVGMISSLATGHGQTTRGICWAKCGRTLGILMVRRS